jgi:ATP-dependent Clp protease ATP-binding subunit ClpB
VTDQARRYIARQGFDPIYGARPLRRYIAREVETKIGRALLADAIPDQSTIRLDITDDDLVVTYHAAQVHP